MANIASGAPDMPSHPNGFASQFDEIPASPVRSPDSEDLGLTAEKIAVFHSWKTYMSLQEDTSEVPNFEDRIRFYVKNRWSGPAAWQDFHKIIHRFQDEIVWEGGRLKFKIPNFQVKSFTEDIFRKFMYDMEKKHSSEIGILPWASSEPIVRLVHEIRERALPDGMFRTQGLEDILTAPAIPRSDSAGPIATTYKLLDRGFWPRMEESLLQIGYGRFGLGKLEFEIRVILSDFFRKISKDANAEILWLKAPGSSSLDPEGNLTCRMSVIASDEMGRTFRRVLTSTSVLTLLIRHIEKNLSDEILKHLVLTFEIWTPHYGEDRPYHKGKKGIFAKISRP